MQRSLPSQTNLRSLAIHYSVNIILGAETPRKYENAALRALDLGEREQNNKRQSVTTSKMKIIINLIGSVKPGVANQLLP